MGGQLLIKDQVHIQVAVWGLFSPPASPPLLPLSFCSPGSWVLNTQLCFGSSQTPPLKFAGALRKKEASNARLTFLGVILLNLDSSCFCFFPFLLPCYIITSDFVWITYSSYFNTHTHTYTHAWTYTCKYIYFFSFVLGIRITLNS